MKKALLLSSLALAGITAFAQNRTTNFKIEENKQFGLGRISNLIDNNLSGKGTATFTTLLAPATFLDDSKSDSCAFIKSFNLGSTLDSGFITGSNAYGDKEKMMLYAIDTNAYLPSMTIDTVYVYFGAKNNIGGAAAGGNVKAKLYSATSPNTPIATSSSITYANIDTNNNIAKFVFSPAAVVTGNNVMVAVDFTGLTNAHVGITSFATVARTAACDINPARALERWGNNSISRIDTAWGGSFMVDLLIMARTTITEKTSIGNFGSRTVSMKAYPQPATDVLNVEFKSSKTGVVTLNLVDITGRIIATQNVQTTAGVIKSANFNTANLTSGVYFVQMNSATENGSLKVSIN